MRRQSHKARQVAEERRNLDWSLLAARGSACEGCHLTPVGRRPDPRPWSEKHEILTRARGGSPTDPDNILCLCRDCHKWITEHETAARELGLVRGRTAGEHTATFRPWQQPTSEERN